MWVSAVVRDVPLASLPGAARYSKLYPVLTQHIVARLSVSAVGAAVPLGWRPWTASAGMIDGCGMVVAAGGEGDGIRTATSGSASELLWNLAHRLCHPSPAGTARTGIRI